MTFATTVYELLKQVPDFRPVYDRLLREGHLSCDIGSVSRPDQKSLRPTGAFPRVEWQSDIYAVMREFFQFALAAVRGALDSRTSLQDDEVLLKAFHFVEEASSSEDPDTQNAVAVQFIEQIPVAVEIRDRFLSYMGPASLQLLREVQGSQ